MPVLLARRSARRLIGGAITALTIAATGSALANGRFPAAQQLVVSPGDPNRLWLRATHGFLTSTDRGKSWRWICERAVGYQGTQDPAFGVTQSGQVLAGIFRGLSTTMDGCVWGFEPTVGEQNVIDVSVDKNDAKRAVLLTSTGNSDGGGYINQVWRTTDAGASWTKLADLHPQLLGFTLDTAPSEPTWFYVTGSMYIEEPDGATSAQGVLWRSKDDAKTWERIDIPGTSNTNQPYLSAVHPTNPNALYLRIRGPDVEPPAPAGVFVENELRYSSDGGQTWQEILRAKADFLGFQLAPDGASVLLGMGDPRTPGLLRPVDKTVLGLYSAQAPAHRFEKIYPGHIGCLTIDGNELWVCGSQFEDNQQFELGLSKDLGRTVTSVMKLSDLRGPVQCPCETSTGQNCYGQTWQSTCSLIARCKGDGDPQSITFCGTPSDAGVDGNDGGDTGDVDESGCGCRAPAQFGAGGVLALGALVASLATLLAQRRKRRTARPAGSPRPGRRLPP